MIQIGTQTALTDFNDPFNKDCIIRFSTWVSKCDYSGGLNISGKIEFRNGNTTGLQKFEADTFDDLLSKMKEFAESLD